MDAEVDKAFFAGLDFKAIPNVPEPKSLRPCCILGNDIGAEVESIPVPGYEIRYTLDVDTLGTHQFNKGFVTFEARGGKRLLSDEVSGILYTCRGGFLDIAHVRDNADRTVFFASQIEQLAATGGTIPLSGDGAGARHRIVLKPLDKQLVRAHGLREVVVSLAEWLDYQAGIWHEITTWYGWASTPFSERPSAFSPEDLYSNFVGLKIAGTIFRRHAATSELEYERAVTAAIRDALIKLGPLPQAASRRAFEYVDGIWWDSTKRVPDNMIVRHRNFNIGPKLTAVEAGRCRALGGGHGVPQGVRQVLQGRLEGADPERARSPRGHAVPRDGHDRVSAGGGPGQGRIPVPQEGRPHRDAGRLPGHRRRGREDGRQGARPGRRQAGGPTRREVPLPRRPLITPPAPAGTRRPGNSSRWHCRRSRSREA